MNILLLFIPLLALAAHAQDTEFRVTSAFPKYETADIEFRDASGAKWPSFLHGKPANETGAITFDLAKAEARLTAVDRLDLLGWLDEWQREAARWQGNFWKLYNDVHRWHDHLARKDEPEPAGEDAERRRAFRGFLDPPEEIINAADPLAAILAKNKHLDVEADD